MRVILCAVGKFVDKYLELLRRTLRYGDIIIATNN